MMGCITIETAVLDGLTKFVKENDNANGAISVNGETVKDPGFMVDSTRTLDGRNLVVRRGKKKHYLCSLK